MINCFYNCLQLNADKTDFFVLGSEKGTNLSNTVDGESKILKTKEKISLWYNS